MKNFLLFLLSLTSLSSFDALADTSLKENVCQDLVPINFDDLTQENLNAIMQGECPEVAIQFLAQTELPIDFYLRGDLVNLVTNEEKMRVIQIKQTFYVRYVDEKWLFSTNLTDWKPFFEFLTGCLSVNIQTEQPLISVGADINLRPL